MSPDSLDAGLKHHQAGDFEQAEKVYRRILRIDPKHSEALHLSGVLAHQRGETQKAVALIGEAIAVEGSNPLYHSNLGAAFEALGQHQEAVHSFRKAVELDPRYADAHFNLGVALESIDENHSAEECYRRTIAVNPEHAEAHNNLGILLKARGELDEALACYNRALEIRPGFAFAHYNRGVALHARGEFEAARHSYELAIERSPEYVEAHDMLGLVNVELGDYDNAYACHKTAARLLPHHPKPWLNLGSVCVKLNRLDEAWDCFVTCRERLTGDFEVEYATIKALSVALVEHSRALSQQGQTQSARNVLKEAQALDPQAATVLFELGTILQQDDEWEAAAQCFERCLALQPQNAAAQNNLAACLTRLGRLDEAAEACRLAIEQQPDFAEAHYNLAGIRRDQGRLDEAIRGYHEAIHHQPAFSSAHNNLGSLLQSLNRLEEAVECYRRAASYQPDVATPHINLGSLLQTLDRHDEAEQAYQAALEIDPRNALAYNNLGTIASMRGQTDAAIEAFRKAVEFDPDYLDAITNLVCVLKPLGEVDECRTILERTLAKRPSNKLRVLLATLLPPVFESHSHLKQWRQRFVDQIDALVKDGITLDADREKLPNNFLMAYQGENDVEVQKNLARLYPTSDYRPLERPTSARIRIGFLSYHFRDHTIGRLVHGLIAGLNRDEFEVVVLALNSSQDRLARQIAADADEYVCVSSNLPAARGTIAGQHLDVLLFTDLGMDPISYSLAFTRFAPVQCVTWGHPVTTGIPTIDYFLSSELIEPPDADEHYSERLVRFKGLPTVYSRPVPPDPLRPRSAFGLPDDAHLYVCPQSLFKFHPDFDAVMQAILRRDPRGRIVLLNGARPQWTETLQRRFAATIPDVLDRIQFLPHQTHAGFLNLLSVCDVMLDPLHFGGGNSTFEGLACGLPIVTLPARFMRGRFTAACYQRIGMTDCIASDVDKYVDLAVRLGTDREFSQTIRDRLAAARMPLYNDTSVLREIEDFFRSVCGRIEVPAPETISAEWTPTSDPTSSVGQVSNLSEITRSVSEAVEPIGDPSNGSESTDLGQVGKSVLRDVAADLTVVSPIVRHPLSEILQSNTCPACGHHVSVPFYDGGRLPLTTLAWPRSMDEAQAMPRLPHSFVRCVDCGHVSNCEFDYANVPYSDKPNLMFNRGLLWKEHLQRVRDLILERVGPTPVVAEIGCGDAHLLRALAEQRPAGRYVGFDPSGAIDDGGGIIEGRRELFLPDRHVAELRPDLIVSRHVLEHLMNPLGFVQALGFACSWEDVETLLLIEVPCIDGVFSSGRTVDFFYEHNSHFTTTSLRRLLLRCASEVELIERSYNDEVVYGLARFRRRGEHVDFAAEALRFRDKAETSRENVRLSLDRLGASGTRVAIWGGTGKAAAFINQYGLDAERFPIVVDSDADKAGTYVPGMGQEIRYRDHLIEHPVDVIVIATQWRAGDIVLEIERCHIPYQAIVLEHQGKLVNFHHDPHPYRKAG